MIHLQIDGFGRYVDDSALEENPDLKRLFQEKITNHRVSFSEQMLSIDGQKVTEKKAALKIAQIFSQSVPEAKPLVQKLSSEVSFEQARIQRLLQLVKSSPQEVLKDPDFMRISDGEALMEILHQIKAPPAILVRNILALGFTDQRLLTALAKSLAQKHGFTAEHFKQFGIQNENARFEIAMAMIQGGNGGKMVRSLGDFALTEARYLDLAMSLAEKSALQPIEYLDRLHIYEEEDRFQIAKKFAHQPHTSLGINIDKYAFSQEHLVQLAFILAENGAYTLSLDIPKFKIEKESDRAGIALLLAEKNVDHLAENISNFALRDQKSLVSIAMQLVKNGRSEILGFLDRFPIEREEERYLLAKECVKFSEFFRFFSSFHIQNPDYLHELLMIYLETENALYTICQKESQFFQQFGVHSEEEKEKILRKAVEYNLQIITESSAVPVSKVVRDQFSQVFELTYRNQNSKTREMTFRFFCETMFQLLNWEKIPLDLQNAVSQAAQEKNVYILDQLQFFLVEFLEICLLKHVNQEQIEQGAPYFHSIFTLRNPLLREKLLPLLLRAIGQLPKKHPLFSHLTSNRYFPSFLVLSAMYTEKSTWGEKAQQIIQNEFFRDRRNQIGLCNDLLAILHNDKIAPEQKNVLLNQIFHSDLETCVVRSRQVKLFLSLDDLEFLQKDPLEWSSHLSHLFSQKYNLGSVENFWEKFDKTFNSFRQSDALFRYAARIFEMDEDLLFTSLNQYILSVLEGTFHDLRYKADQSDHLEKLSHFPALMEKWKLGAQYSLDHFLPTAIPPKPAVSQESLTLFFKTKLCAEKQIPKLQENFPLSDYLNGELDIHKTEEKLKQHMLNADIPTKKFISIQNQILALTKEPHPSNKVILEKIIKLKQTALSAKEMSFLHQLEIFENEIRSLESSRTKARFANWTMVDSDDPCDLLLCGTEVEGSCQSVDDDSQLNKALLAYLLDGKNRLLAIKDRTGKIIARSILRILFDDEEKPILFMEKIYPHVLDDVLAKALQDAAKQRAQELGIPLVSQMKVGHEYEGNVTSYGSLAPYEYVDAQYGIEVGGKFTIHSLLYSNEKQAAA